MANQEKDLQKAIVSAVRKFLPGTIILANPMTDQKLPSSWSGLQRKRFFDRMKAEGWQKSQPDLFFPYGKNGFNGLALELKTPEKNPVRIFKKGPDVWLNKTQDRSARYYHALAQAEFLAGLRTAKNFAAFCDDFYQAMAIIKSFVSPFVDTLPKYSEIEIWKECEYSGQRIPAGHIHRFE